MTTNKQMKNKKSTYQLHINITLQKFMRDQLKKLVTVLNEKKQSEYKWTQASTMRLALVELCEKYGIK